MSFSSQIQCAPCSSPIVSWLSRSDVFSLKQISEASYFPCPYTNYEMEN